MGMVWYGMVWYGMVWYGMVWYGMVWYGMVRYGMVWYGMVWYGTVWYVTRAVAESEHCNQGDPVLVRLLGHRVIAVYVFLYHRRLVEHKEVTAESGEQHVLCMYVCTIYVCNMYMYVSVHVYVSANLSFGLRGSVFELELGAEMLAGCLGKGRGVPFPRDAASIGRTRPRPFHPHCVVAERL